MGHVRKATGFTLAELVLTLAVLAIVAVAAVPLLPNLAQVDVDAAAKRLSHDLAYARHLARTRNATFGISFDVNADVYTVFRVDPITQAETTILHPHTGAPMQVDLAALARAEIIAPNFTGTAVVRFTPEGIPEDGTGNPLQAAGSVQLQDGTALRTVLVEPGTGEVQAQ